MFAALLCGLAFHACSAPLGSALTAPRQARTPPITRAASGNHGRKIERTLSPRDGLAVISAALNSKVRRYSEHDCSHLVHAVYDRAGFPYAYADSDDLYLGVEGFQRVTHPQPGDLVVWRGHAGIVVRPSSHAFFSFLSGGPGIDNYQAPYWIGRGRPRFFRYVKNDPCPGCNPASTARGPTRDAN
jgi:cell wall-associated NlpC family hydrolase